MNLPFGIEELRTFVLLAEYGNFTETARALNISQPAVSQRISRLENAWGLLLFTRSAERVTLTDYGRKLLPEATRCVNRHLQLRSRVRRLNSSPDEPVRLWLDAASLGKSHIQQVLDRLPNSPRLNIIQSPNRSLPPWPERLHELDCDLALAGVFLEPKAPSGFISQSLSREAGLTIAWSQRRHTFTPEAICLPEILRLPLLLPSESSLPGFRSFIDDWCRRAYHTSPHFLEFEYPEEILSVCARGDGIAFFPGHATRRFDFAGARLSCHTLFGEVLPYAFSFTLFQRDEEDRPEVIEVARCLTDAGLKH